jgi:uncharacterized protein (DUF4415 family)
MPASRRIIHTDLAKLDAHEIQPEEYEDIPELTDEWFGKAEFAVGGKVVRPAKHTERPKSGAAKKLIMLRLDPDVIERFRATGPGWQSRINAVLREYLERT